MSDQPTCGKKARNRYGEIHCDNPPNHEGDCDFGSLPVTAREDQPRPTPRQVWEFYKGRKEAEDQWITVDRRQMDEAFASEAQGAAPQTCSCSEKHAAVCRSMPQHQPEYCRVKAAQPPQDARAEFEKWAEKSFGGNAQRFFVRCPGYPDEYKHTDVQSAWEAWLAARSTPSPDPPQKFPFTPPKYDAEYEEGMRKLDELVASNPPLQIVSAPELKDALIGEIARELYDRFMMGGWEPKDTWPLIDNWLTEYASSSNAAQVAEIERLKRLLNDKGVAQ